ncbi:MAG: Methyltransferase FkbM [Microgenomates group bacterium GW2011_GWC1_46_16]|nr:MAG: Methyltransferase FkbM [Microgenomates group bacterium GW2011_GWF1_46_12]KKU26713.1 MAG: Methyltransferase FkbM [Microgenomates group bacterium GW2011_GWC1_46_16]KKU27558.1 MAG: Methyltransferase FkbM [Microgenomates group bacterium GW2011_GWF2_46_18]KKU43597.1 MAG: Methyltransferase FkbM [Microgenomates group bacterium GW2011_GWA1_46_7]KKU45099.1 MAG: Methyltransferase FkbM [Microgenomates group bacterium GW2011_GWB1_46_7]KKU60453.1 MAG: Methyltransferase FkbM [Microgenomates group ba
MEKILEKINMIFGGRGMDKKFPFLLWLFKYVFAMIQKDSPITVNTGYGKNLIVSARDAGLGLMLRTRGKYEPLLTDYLQTNVKQSVIAVDIGANVGYFTKQLAELVGNKGRVIGFEPCETNWKYLTKNVAGHKNVVIVQVALSDTDGLHRFSEDRANPGENGLSRRGNLRVKTMTMDGWMKAKRIQKINLIKIDVEGAEVMVLKGAKTMIRNQKKITVICECNPEALQKLGYSAIDLTKILKSCGLKIGQIMDERLKIKCDYTPEKLNMMLAKSAYVTLISEGGYAK